MKGSKSAITDLVAAAGSKPQSVGQRIERRLEILREWLQEGIPVDKSLPKDLTAVRVWEDIELGVARISSPNEFTRTHLIHGARVCAIEALLGALKKHLKEPDGKSNATNAHKTLKKVDRSELEREVSLWHSERDQRLQEKKRADSAEARSTMLLLESKEKDELIADLRRQLAAKQGLRGIE